MPRPAPDIIDFLASVTPFDALPRADLERIAGWLEIRYCRGGDNLGVFGTGDGHELFIVRKGAVRLTGDGGESLEQRGEGELFGHAILFSPPKQRYRATAIEDCLVWRLDAEAAGRIRAAYPSLAEFLDADHGERLRQSRTGRAGASRICELALREPIAAGPSATIAECARKMAARQASCLPLIDGGRLVGIITDRDLRNRVLARDVAPDQAVAGIMTADPATVAPEARIEDALVEMMRLGIHHLPVIETGGRLAGVVSAGDLMRVQAPHPLRLVRDLQRADSRDAVAALARQAPGLLAGLVRAGTGASELGRIAGRITDACTRRLLELARQQLGPAPQRWAWLAFGSQARLEQGLISDQDNGLLLADECDAKAERYFAALAEAVCDGLNDCGYVYCPGGVMAKGAWRMRLADWRARFDGWMREPEPRSVMHSSIFFDMRAVAGDIELARQLHGEVLGQARDAEIFRRFLAAESMQHRPPIGLFRQFVQEHGGAQSQGLNLKKRGVIPIVDLARVRALEGALEVIHTEERIHAAAGAGQMTERDADDLVHALGFIGDIRLAHQVRRIDAGEPPDHLVDPAELSGLHRRYLRSAFGIVSAAQKALAQRYLL